MQGMYQECRSRNRAGGAGRRPPSNRRPRRGPRPPGHSQAPGSRTRRSRCASTATRCALPSTESGHLCLRRKNACRKIYKCGTPTFVCINELFIEIGLTGGQRRRGLCEGDEPRPSSEDGIHEVHQRGLARPGEPEEQDGDDGRYVRLLLRYPAGGEPQVPGLVGAQSMPQVVQRLACNVCLPLHLLQHSEPRI